MEGEERGGKRGVGREGREGKGREGRGGKGREREGKGREREGEEREGEEREGEGISINSKLPTLTLIPWRLRVNISLAPALMFPPARCYGYTASSHTGIPFPGYIGQKLFHRLPLLRHDGHFLLSGNYFSPP